MSYNNCKRRRMIQAGAPLWFDQSEVPEKLQKTWQEARESMVTKFKFGTYENSGNDQ